MIPLPDVTASDASLYYAGGAALVAASGLFAMLYLAARTACDGARITYVGDIPERFRTPLHVEAEQQRPDDLHPASLGHDLPQAGAVVGNRGGQSIHNEVNSRG